MKRFFRVSLFSLLLALASACGEEAADCPAGESACGDSCVDIFTDPMNCGGCGNLCAAGELCIQGACGCPDGLESCEALIPDLFGLCFQAGQMVPLDKESGQRTGASLSGMEGPQTMAALDDDHIVVVGALDQTLRVVERRSMEVVGSLTFAKDAGATSPNHVIVEGERAFVVQSTTHELTVVDLSDPSAPRVVYSVSTGEGSNPFIAAWAEGTIYVSLLQTDSLLPVRIGSDDGEALEPILIEAEELEGVPNPSGVAAWGGKIFVALNNLDENYAPAGNGRLWVYDRDEESQELIDLGEECKNPGFVAADEEAIYVSCTGTYSGDGAVVVFDPSQGEVLQVIPTGGAPSRISIDGSTLYVADSMGRAILRIEEGVGADAIPICAERDFEFVSDVLVLP